MTLFSEYFVKLKDRRNLTGAQIAEKCGKDKSSIFYWQTGRKLPKKWEFLKEIIEYMQLFPSEKKELRSAYEKTKYGEETYAYYKSFFEIIEVLQERRNEYFVMLNGREEKYSIADFTDMLRLENKLEIVRGIQLVLDYLEMQKEKRMYIKMSSFRPEVLMVLKLFCGKVEDCHIELIVCLSDFNDETGIKNLELWKDALEVIVQKNEIEVYIAEADNSREEVGANWILSEEFAIQFDANCTNGMLYTQSQWLTFFQTAFQKLKRESKYVGNQGYRQGEYRFVDKEDIVIGSSIGYMPQIFEGLKEETSNFQENIRWQSYFSYEGLIQFMETGIIENLSNVTNKPMRMQERCNVLQNLIQLMESGERQYHIICEEIDMQKIYLEQVESPTPYFSIEIYMENGEHQRYIIEETGFQQKFKEFLEYLKEEGYVYGEEESLRRMKEVLERYRG